MTDLLGRSLKRIAPYFPMSHGVPRVDDHRVGKRDRVRHQERASSVRCPNGMLPRRRRTAWPKISKSERRQRNFAALQSFSIGNDFFRQIDIEAGKFLQSKVGEGENAIFPFKAVGDFLIPCSALGLFCLFGGAGFALCDLQVFGVLLQHERGDLILNMLLQCLPISVMRKLIDSDMTTEKIIHDNFRSPSPAAVAVSIDAA